MNEHESWPQPAQYFAISYIPQVVLQSFFPISFAESKLAYFRIYVASPFQLTHLYSRNKTAKHTCSGFNPRTPLSPKKEPSNQRPSLLDRETSFREAGMRSSHPSPNKVEGGKEDIKEKRGGKNREKRMK